MNKSVGDVKTKGIWKRVDNISKLSQAEEAKGVLRINILKAE